MKKHILILAFIATGCSSKKDQRYVPDSNGNLNQVTVVMNNTQWEGVLGDAVRDQIATIYEGLPMDEPRFSLKQLARQLVSHRHITFVLKYY